MIYKKSIIAAFIFLPTFTITASESKPQQKYPTFVRLSLAGANLVDEESYTKYDAKERYYLIATGDCDGASVDLILQPNRFDSGTKIERVSLPRLRNGKGINIGDSPKQVQKKLGAAPHRSHIEESSNLRQWNYYANIFVVGRKGSRAKVIHSYRADYNFRNGRLWSIAYNIHEKDGC